MMKIVVLTTSILLTIPSIACQEKAKKEIELVAYVDIKKTDALYTIFSYIPGNNSYRMHIFENDSSETTTDYFIKKPLFNSEAGKKRRKYQLIKIIKIPAATYDFLQKATSAARNSAAHKYNDACSTWKYDSNGNVQFIRAKSLSGNLLSDDDDNNSLHEDEDVNIHE